MFNQVLDCVCQNRRFYYFMSDDIKLNNLIYLYAPVVTKEISMLLIKQENYFAYKMISKIMMAFAITRNIYKKIYINIYIEKDGWGEIRVIYCACVCVTKGDKCKHTFKCQDYVMTLILMTSAFCKLHCYSCPINFYD